MDVTRALKVLALAATSIAFAFPASESASAQLRAIDIFEDFSDSPVDATSVRFCWGGDHTAESDSWTIRRAAGATPPPPDAPPEAILPGGTEGVCYTATGLVTDAAYTFRVTGHDADGESEPGNFTVAAREQGNYVLSGASNEKLPRSEERGAPQVAVTRDRRWHVMYTTPREPGRQSDSLSYSTRSKSGWTAPAFLGSTYQVGDYWLVTNGGSLMAAWDPFFDPAKYRLESPGATRFGARRTLPSRDDLEDVAIDRHGHVHLLVMTNQQGPQYRTNASGRWRDQRIRGGACVSYSLPPGCYPSMLLAYDRVTDRLVAVSQFFETIRVATKRASARKFGSFRYVDAPNKLGLNATSLSSRDGLITLGLQSKPGRYLGEGSGPLYAMVGSQLVRVPGTTADDFNLLVAASSRDRVQLAWQRRSASWDLAEQGIWTAEAARNKKTGRWSIGSITHRTQSHYDQLSSFTVDARGRGLAAYVR